MYSRLGPTKAAAEETLDPSDWNEVRDLSHRIVDDAVGYLRDVRERPVWQDMPTDVRASFEAPLPRSPAPHRRGLSRGRRDGDGLPDGQRPSALLGLVHGVEQFHRRDWRFSGCDPGFQPWRRQSRRRTDGPSRSSTGARSMVGFPASASGTLVSGGSMANIVGLTVARNVKAGVDVRELGVAAIEKSLCFYGSDQIHSPAIARRWRRSASATRRCGAFRRPRTCELDVDALRAAIAKDRADGLAARPA